MVHDSSCDLSYDGELIVGFGRAESSSDEDDAELEVVPSLTATKPIPKDDTIDKAVQGAEISYQDLRPFETETGVGEICRDEEKGVLEAPKRAHDMSSGRRICTDLNDKDNSDQPESDWSDRGSLGNSIDQEDAMPRPDAGTKTTWLQWVPVLRQISPAARDHDLPESSPRDVDTVPTCTSEALEQSIARERIETADAASGSREGIGGSPTETEADSDQMSAPSESAIRGRRKGASEKSCTRSEVSSALEAGPTMLGSGESSDGAPLLSAETATAVDRLSIHSSIAENSDSEREPRLSFGVEASGNDVDKVAYMPSNTEVISTPTDSLEPASLESSASLSKTCHSEGSSLGNEVDQREDSLNRFSDEQVLTSPTESPESSELDDSQPPGTETDNSGEDNEGSFSSHDPHEVDTRSHGTSCVDSEPGSLETKDDLVGDGSVSGFFSHEEIEQTPSERSTSPTDKRKLLMSSAVPSSLTKDAVEEEKRTPSEEQGSNQLSAETLLVGWARSSADIECESWESNDGGNFGLADDAASDPHTSETVSAEDHLEAGNFLSKTVSTEGEIGRNYDRESGDISRAPDSDVNDVGFVESHAIEDEAFPFREGIGSLHSNSTSSDGSVSDQDRSSVDEKLWGEHDDVLTEERPLVQSSNTDKDSTLEGVDLAVAGGTESLGRIINDESVNVEEASFSHSIERREKESVHDGENRSDSEQSGISDASTSKESLATWENSNSSGRSSASGREESRRFSTSIHSTDCEEAPVNDSFRESESRGSIVSLSSAKGTFVCDEVTRAALESRDQQEVRSVSASNSVEEGSAYRETTEEGDDIDIAVLDQERREADVIAAGSIVTEEIADANKESPTAVEHDVDDAGPPASASEGLLVDWGDATYGSSCEESLVIWEQSLSSGDDVEQYRHDDGELAGEIHEGDFEKGANENYFQSLQENASIERKDSSSEPDLDNDVPVEPAVDGSNFAHTTTQENQDFEGVLPAATDDDVHETNNVEANDAKQLPVGFTPDEEFPEMDEEEGAEVDARKIAGSESDSNVGTSDGLLVAWGDCTDDSSSDDSLVIWEQSNSSGSDVYLEEGGDPDTQIEVAESTSEPFEDSGLQISDDESGAKDTNDDTIPEDKSSKEGSQYSGSEQHENKSVLSATSDKEIGSASVPDSPQPKIETEDAAPDAPVPETEDTAETKTDDSDTKEIGPVSVEFAGPEESSKAEPNEEPEVDLENPASESHEVVSSANTPQVLKASAEEDNATAGPSSDDRSTSSGSYSSGSYSSDYTSSSSYSGSYSSDFSDDSKASVERGGPTGLPQSSVKATSGSELNRLEEGEPGMERKVALSRRISIARVFVRSLKEGDIEKLNQGEAKEAKRNRYETLSVDDDVFTTDSGDTGKESLLGEDSRMDGKPSIIRLGDGASWLHCIMSRNCLLVLLGLVIIIVVMTLSLTLFASGGAAAAPLLPSAAPSLSEVPTMAPTYAFTEKSWEQVGKPLFGEEDEDQAGFSMSMSNDGFRVVVGARRASSDGTNRQGGVKIYRYGLPGGQPGWIEEDTIYGVAANDMFGFSVSLSGNGRRLAVGSIGNDNNGKNAGFVEMYELQGRNWRLIGDFTGEAEGDVFGASVALNTDGSHLAVGAPYHASEDLQRSGKVYFYEDVGFADEPVWERSRPPLSGGAEEDRFGWSVGFSEDASRVVVGAPLDGNREEGGYAQAYQFVGLRNNWAQLGRDLTENNANDRFGYSVSIDGSGRHIAVGAFNSTTIVGSNAGHALVYRLEQDDWETLGQELRGGERSGNFGFSVQISSDGNYVVAGAPNTRNSEGGRGLAQVYQISPRDEIWVGSEAITSSVDSRLGYATAIATEGARVAVGSPFTNEGTVFE
uniref:Uncharacterized protein n=1 Tax=Grammatophora oceanica TaxID=210454 RepID=A0A7S1VMH7_9STRA